MTLEDKKQLYRHSFRMTLAETLAPHPRWKLGVAWACFVMSASLLYLAFVKSVGERFCGKFKTTCVCTTCILSLFQFSIYQQ